jgi:orotate phosphoribosyltransferase
MDTIAGKIEAEKAFLPLRVSNKNISLEYNKSNMRERERLIEIIRERSFKYSNTPIFPLSSGAKSHFYFDMKKTFSSGEAQFLVGKLIFEKMKEMGLEVQAIGGLTMGADPIAYAVARYSYDVKEPIKAFVIRKIPKEHGLQLPIEGDIEKGDTVLIVDDVVTTGNATIKAINIARENGLIVEAAMILIDRCEQNGRQNIEALHLPVYDIFTVKDFIK